jgi:choline dehydrogenase-like flavoprotein
LSDYEFKGKSHDGFGDDWPISHADLDPYYAQAEAILRVRGGKDGVPQLPDGNYIVDTAPWTRSMLQVRAAIEQKGMSFLLQRQALGVDGLASSVNLLLPKAFQSGKLKAVPNVVVRELTVDRNRGLVDGANFVDRLTRREMSVKARRVVLAAGTLESTRLLLNSKIANSSGVLGHYLADQCYGVGVNCSVPEARGKQDVTGLMGGGAVIPRFRNISVKSPGFVRGYGFNITSQSGRVTTRCFAAYGAELQRKLDEYHNSGLTIGVMGEALSHYENHVRISKDVVDAWGIPALHVDTPYTDNEFNLSSDAADTAAELAEAAGLEVLARNAVPNPPGYSIHELGTCRMGNDPKTSVLNKWNQSHDIKNLFVVDGSSFVSAGWQNPTLTILVLAMRSSQFLAEQIRVGAV